MAVPRNQEPGTHNQEPETTHQDPPATLDRRSWGRVSGWVIDAETQQPLRGATVRVEVEGRFPEDGRAVGESDRNGRYQVRAPLGRISRRLDWARVLTLHPFSLLFGPGVVTRQTRAVNVAQLNVEVSLPGYRPYRAPAPVWQTDARAFAVTLHDLRLAPEESGLRSFVAENAFLEQLEELRVEPEVATPGERVRITARVRLPEERGFRYQALVTSSTVLLRAEQPLDRPRREQPDDGTALFTREVRLPREAGTPYTEIGFMLLREREEAPLAAPPALLQVIADESERAAAERVADGHRLAEAGEWDAALAAYEEAQRLAPEYRLALLLHGDLCLSLDRPAEAAASYERLVELRPDDIAVARPRWAHALLQLGDTEAAARSLGEAGQRRQLLPPSVHLARARIAAQQGDFETADENLTQAARGGAPLPPELTAEIHLLRMAAAVEERPADAPLRLAYARLLGNADRWAEAAAEIQRALRDDPGQAWAYLDLAEAYAHLERPDLALLCLEQAVRAAPQNVLAREALAEGYWHAARYEEALPLFREIVERQPLNPAARFHLALLLLHAGERHTARAELAEVLDLARAKGELRDRRLALGLQAIYWSPKRRLVAGFDEPEGELAAVILAALEGLDRDADHPLAWFNLGAALVEAGAPELARPALERALQAEPGLLEARFQAALGLRAAGEPRAAARKLRAVVAAHPLHPRARLELADLLLELGEPEEAQLQLHEHRRHYPRR